MKHRWEVVIILDVQGQGSVKTIEKQSEKDCIDFIDKLNLFKI